MSSHKPQHRLNAGENPPAKAISEKEHKVLRKRMDERFPQQYSAWGRKRKP